MQSSFAVRVVAVMLAVSALAACSRPAGPGDQGYITGDGGIEQIAVADRGEPIDYTGELLDGSTLALADLHGKPVVLTVWASWCTPCRDEAPVLVAAKQALGQRAHFVGLNIRDQVSSAQAMERTFGFDWPSYNSPDSDVVLAFPGTLTPTTIPATVVLDSQGRIAARIIGSVPTALTLEQVVQDVIAGG